MEVYYESTRGGEKHVTASQAILNGLAADGGLYVPDHIPALPVDVTELAGRSYQEIAFIVMREFLTDFTDEELHYCIDNAYDSKFDTPEIAPIREADGAYFLELYHGKTIAFKDMALSILPYLMTTSSKKNGNTNEIVILTATSGDTGKAAMAGFADVAGTRIIVFYPKDGVSRVQELQMITQKGSNTYVVGIHGNFDDAQTGVKKIFGDKEFCDELEAAGYQFSSANSINIGRLVPQVVYYVYAYVKLYEKGVIGKGEKIDFVVPTGNFGNILAAFFAKEMGLPVDRLICASNDNKVLCDFFNTGEYDKNREFILTTSPSMDILVSSNLERLIYLSCGRDAQMTSEFMDELNESGKYEITPDMRSYMSCFWGGYADMDENAAEIRKIYSDTGYLIDTHTGVAACVYEKYKEATGDTKPAVIASTASPYKFAGSVMEAIFGDQGGKDEFELVDEMSRVSGTKVPEAIEEIRTAEILHTKTCTPEEMKETVKSIFSNDAK